MSANVKTQEPQDMDKADVQILENNLQYASLSPEDAEFMKRYEGKAGKRVVRKVCDSSYQNFTRHFPKNLQILRLMSDLFPSWRYYIY